MGYEYHVIKVLQHDLEARINAAAGDGWEVVSIHASRMMYGLGGEYEVKEVSITLRRRVSNDLPRAESPLVPLPRATTSDPNPAAPASDAPGPGKDLPELSGAPRRDLAA